MNHPATCALCRRDGQELQASHFQPAGVYRAIRDETQENPNPIMFLNDRVFQDSRRISDYLLCWECEQRLSKMGENWFLAHCSRKGRFRLMSLLEETKREVLGQRISIYRAANIPKFEVAALAYFASSEFWRASVHQWQMNGSECRRIQLGPYEEPLRKYLMGDAQFPENCALWVSVPESVTSIAGRSLTPYGGRQGGHHVYKLVVLGMGFDLLAGKDIPPESRKMCFVRGVGNPIMRTDMLEDSIMQDLNYKFSLRPQLLEGPRG